MIRLVLRRSVWMSAVVSAPRVDAILDQTTEKDKQTGWDRVKELFIVDEYGNNHPKLNSILQTTFFSGFVGACWGGFLRSKDAYLNFIQRHQATRFTDHYEAKKKLQDFVTVNFAKGAWHWGWRIALFGSCYITFVTLLMTYNGNESIFYYGLGGLFSGAISKINMGPRGAVAGGTLGLLLGLFAGAITMTILKITGSSLDDVQNWQHQLSDSRMKALAENARRRGAMDHLSLLESHDQAVKER